MITKLLIAWCLMALCVTIHAIGLEATFRLILRPKALGDRRSWAPPWLLIKVAGCLIALHLAQIAVWALFYWSGGCFPDAESAFYFAGVTYTTLGYGDLVLPPEWRMLAPIEGLNGILMCGLSTGFFFAVLSKLYIAHLRHPQPSN
jgi:hypothetical protein